MYIFFSVSMLLRFYTQKYRNLGLQKMMKIKGNDDVNHHTNQVNIQYEGIQPYDILFISATSLVNASLASPKSMDVFGLKNNSFSIPA